MSYNEWLDIDVLEDYLDGKLDAKAMHQVEKLSLEDPFVAEALEGLSKSPKRSQSLSLLQKQLQERTALKPIEKKRWTITSQRLSIAAAAAVLFIAVSILFWMKGNKRQEMLASNEPKKVDVKIAPQVAADKQDPTSTVVADKVVLDKPAEPIAIVKKADEVKAIKEAPIVAVERPVVMAAPVAPAAPSVARQRTVAEEMETIALSKSKKQSESKVAVMALPSKAEGIIPSYFSGKVISKENGLPIPGAIVRISGVDRGITTDKNGEFKIASDSTQSQKLTVGYIGYTTTEVGARSNQPINVLLENDNKSLNEVVIVNAASKANAAPLDGWDNYQTYLKANNKLAKNIIDKQEVELDFQVRKDGSVTAIKVVKSGGKVNDQEAIRLLKDGPKWIFNVREKNLGKLKISF